MMKKLSMAVGLSVGANSETPATQELVSPSDEKKIEAAVKLDVFLRKASSVSSRVWGSFPKSLTPGAKRFAGSALPSTLIAVSPTPPPSPGTASLVGDVGGQDFVTLISEATPYNKVDIPILLERVRCAFVNEHRQKHLVPGLAKKAYTILLKAKALEKFNVDVEFWLGLAARRASSFHSCIDKRNRPFFEKLSFASVIERKPESLYSSDTVDEALSPDAGLPYWEVLAKCHLETALDICPEDKNIRLHYAAAARDLSVKYTHARGEYLKKLHPDDCPEDRNMTEAYALRSETCIWPSKSVKRSPSDFFAALMNISHYLDSQPISFGLLQSEKEANGKIPFLNFLLMRYYWLIKLEHYRYKTKNAGKKTSKEDDRLIQQRCVMYEEAQEIRSQLIKIDPYSPAVLAVASLEDKITAAQQLSPQDVGEASVSFFLSGCLARQDDQITVETRIGPDKPLETLEPSKWQMGTIWEE